MKPVFTLPVLLIVFYLSVKDNLPWYVCFFLAWGVMDWVGMLYEAIRKTSQEMK